MSQMDFREVVLAELERVKMSRYRLARMLDGVVAERTLYGWLSGNQRIADDKLAAICEVLGITFISQQ